MNHKILLLISNNGFTAQSISIFNAIKNADTASFDNNWNMPKGIDLNAWSEDRTLANYGEVLKFILGHHLVCSQVSNPPRKSSKGFKRYRSQQLFYALSGREFLQDTEIKVLLPARKQLYLELGFIQINPEDKSFGAAFMRSEAAKKKDIANQEGYDVGDFVYTRQGKIRLITGHDMPDLKFEDIARKVPGEDNPSFEFKLTFAYNALPGTWSNLNKENFFNGFMEKCPFAIKSFCEWVDGYKKLVNWNEVIGITVKFHHLPWSMQFGIIQDFFAQKFGSVALGLHGIQGCWEEPDSYISSIIFDFITLEMDIRNGDNE